jgi:hypothetical protein
MGYLARAGATTADDLRRAMIYGSTLGSFAVERMGVERLIDLEMDEIEERVARFRDLTSFEQIVSVNPSR